MCRNPLETADTDMVASVRPPALERTPPAVSQHQLGIGFSVQKTDTGETAIGIHWDLPATAIVVGVPVAYAELLVESFGRELQKAIDMAKQSPNPLVIAPATTLDTLKGN
jgi:hypothetical protein